MLQNWGGLCWHVSSVRPATRGRLEGRGLAQARGTGAMRGEVANDVHVGLGLELSVHSTGLFSIIPGFSP